MKIKLNRYKRQLGAVFLWILAFIIVIVIALIIVKIVACAKKVQGFKPKWDDVVVPIMDAELNYWKSQYPEEADISLQVPEIFPLGFGLIIRSSSPSPLSPQVAHGAENPTLEWSTNSTGTEYMAVPMESIESWTPIPDPAIPMMFYHKFVVVTNQ